MTTRIASLAAKCLSRRWWILYAVLMLGLSFSGIATNWLTEGGVLVSSQSLLLLQDSTPSNLTKDTQSTLGRKTRTNETLAPQHNILAPVADSLGGHIDYTGVAMPNSNTLRDPHIYPHNNTLVTVVLSARQNFQQRQTIRDTWGRNHAIYFVIGGPSPGENVAVQLSLVKEQARFRDMIDSIHEESYRSLPYKLRFSYSFIVQKMPKVRWILKVDDDMMARIDDLHTALLQNLNHERAVVAGRIIANVSVKKQGKWAETKYQKETYPLWPQGSCGHVVSRAVAEYIAGMENVVYYQGEDTSIGIWLDEAPNLPVTFVRSLYFQNHGRCNKTQWLVLGHKISPDSMQSCYLLTGHWNSSVHKKKEFLYMQTYQQRLELPRNCLGQRTPTYFNC